MSTIRTGSLATTICPSCDSLLVFILPGELEKSLRASLTNGLVIPVTGEYEKCPTCEFIFHLPPIECLEIKTKSMDWGKDSLKEAGSDER